MPLSGGGGAGVEVVVGRGLCLFLRADASKVPPRQLAQFVSLAVKRAAPFPDPEHAIAWFGQHAAVWYWSRSRVAALLDTPGARVLRHVPEAHLVGRPLDLDGAQLLALQQGWLGRVWQERRLVAERWWPNIPDAVQWADFLRGTGLPASALLPEAAAAPVGETPWVRRQQWMGARTLGETRQWLPKLAVVATAVALAVIAAEVGGGLRAELDARRALQAQAAQRQALDRILTAREQAEEARSEIDGLLALQAPRMQTELLAELGRIMPARSWRVLHWNLAAFNRLELTVEMDQLDATRPVQALEASPMFANVSTEVDEPGKRLTIRVDVLSDEQSADANDVPDPAAAEPGP